MNKSSLIAVTVFSVFIVSCTPPDLLPRQCAANNLSSKTEYPPGWIIDPTAPKVPQLDFKEAALAAKLSYFTYSPDSSIAEEFPGVIINSLPLVDLKYLLYEDTSSMTHYIAIRGTKSIQDFIADAVYIKVHDASLGIMVHAGFEVLGKALYDRIRNDDRFLKEGYRTTITGHSLGGAAALILYLHLVKDSATLGPLYTFGQPKVTNEDGVNKYSCHPIFRFMNLNDPVPLMPPTINSKKDISRLAQDGLYRHLGDEIVFQDSTRFLYRSWHSQDKAGLSLAVSTWEMIIAKKPVNIIDLHSIKLYLKRTEEIVSGRITGEFAPLP